jgi:hypothetical protein
MTAQPWPGARRLVGNLVVAMGDSPEQLFGSLSVGLALDTKKPPG